MRTLIRRELGEMSLAQYYKDDPRTYLFIFGIVGIGFPIILWLLGPGFIGVFGAEDLHSFISIFGLLIVWQMVINGLQHDDSNRQMTFLQTLPVRGSQIVHAKFTGALLLCSCVVIWISLFIFCEFVSEWHTSRRILV